MSRSFLTVCVDDFTFIYCVLGMEMVANRVFKKNKKVTRNIPKILKMITLHYFVKYASFFYQFKNI